MTTASTKNEVTYMAFVNTYERPELNSGEIRADQREVACSLWFPICGNPYPIWFKFRDDNGDIQMVKDIQIKSMEDKNYSGIPSKEYVCHAIIGGLFREFKLIYYVESCQCKLIV